MKFKRGALVSLLASAVLACGQESGEVRVYRFNPAGTGTPVASFGDDSITVEQLEGELAAMPPYSRARYQEVEARRKFVEDLARFELLAAEAHARGLHREPEVIQMAKQVMVQKLLHQEVEKEFSISQAEVERFFEAHRDEYVKPVRHRASYHFVASTGEEARRRAEALAAFRPEPAGEDTGFITEERARALHGPAFAGALRELRAPGDVSGVIQTEKGFYVVKLLERQEALVPTAVQMAASIRERLLAQRRIEAYAALLERAKAKARYHVHEEALAAIEVDPEAPQHERAGPPPAFLAAPSGAPQAASSVATGEAW